MGFVWSCCGIHARATMGNLLVRQYSLRSRKLQVSSFQICHSVPAVVCFYTCEVLRSNTLLLLGKKKMCQKHRSAGQMPFSGFNQQLFILQKWNCLLHVVWWSGVLVAFVSQWSSRSSSKARQTCFLSVKHKRSRPSYSKPNNALCQQQQYI